MSDDEIDQLARELEGARLQREADLVALERTNQTERQLIERIRVARRENPPHERNSHRVGDYVRITNRLRNEYGIIGVVVSSSARLVTVCNEQTNRDRTGTKDIDNNNNFSYGHLNVIGGH